MIAGNINLITWQRLCWSVVVIALPFHFGRDLWTLQKDISCPGVRLWPLDGTGPKKLEASCGEYLRLSGRLHLQRASSSLQASPGRPKHIHGSETWSCIFLIRRARRVDCGRGCQMATCRRSCRPPFLAAGCPCRYRISVYWMYRSPCEDAGW